MQKYEEKKLGYSELIIFLRKEYYREGTEIYQSGDMVLVGDILQYWPVNYSRPLRVHFFGEDIEKVEQRNEAGGWSLYEASLPSLESNSILTEHGRIRPQAYVVHPNHGVGIFEYLVTRLNVDKEIRQYVSILYAGNDRLLFPIERLTELMPYLGGKHPRLTRLYSKSWQKTKEKIQKDLLKIARELLKIYAARQLSTRPVYQSQDEWQSILSKGVDFELTEDQTKALEEIRQDLSERTTPMDRLICGDVGFGKTEVALRAAAQVIASGKQVAFIAPTTILVEQHFVLLQKRFSSLPVRVGHLSRVTEGSEKATLSDLTDGKIDLVVGTHRLLSKDVVFANLGLLILDEEQKFGVAQKELLKKLRPTLDVLSLSATPIPRTLYFSLSGLRGLSTLNIAPTGRLPIKTHVLSYNEMAVRQAICQELARGGQVYLVHNRVQSLALVQQKIEELIKPQFPKARVAMAHGQMDEKRLAETLSNFLAGRIEVLVSSSIIENGLDSPGANTLIVLHSEWFGLSDLYQLRGRIGRRSQLAHAYFMTGGINCEHQVSERTRARLQVLQEADVLGSGWLIALRDLEIRGGGNILGHEQHGNMEAIGLILYSKLLQEAIGQEAKRLNIYPLETFDELK
jgi:transcription-repair coupling factor (superfamily II helicase)